MVNQGIFPYCAMFQVAAEDEEDDYVICRGYDPRIRKFIEYDAEDENKPGIPIAKPFSNREAGSYEVGEIFPAVLPLTRLGQNSGVAAESQGQPADLDEEVELLYTTDEKVVNWIFLDTGSGSGRRWVKLDAALTYDEEEGVAGSIWKDTPLADTGDTVEGILPPLDLTAGLIPSGAACLIEQVNGNWYPTVWPRVLWGTLDSALVYSDTTGVTVNLDMGGTMPLVLPPKGMGGGTIADGESVLIGLIDGHWYVIGAWVKTTVISSIQKSAGKIQVKTRDIVVFCAGDESAWGDITGESTVIQSVLTDFQVSGLTIQTKSRPLYVTPEDDETGWNTEHTGTECPE
jgi:hypothetical protein